MNSSRRYEVAPGVFVVALIAMGLSVESRAQALPTTTSVAGGWTLNKDLSDRPQDLPNDAGSARGEGASGGRRGGGFGGGGFGGRRRGGFGGEGASVAEMAATLAILRMRSGRARSCAM